VMPLLETSVLSLDTSSRQGGRITAKLVGRGVGLFDVSCGAVVLACGCRERTRGQINIAGGRPAGVYTAGTAQRLINVDGALVGRRVVILGSGDIGLIMARRMTWEGADVLCVCELASEPGGLRRNIAQCLDDYGIPLHLSTTVTQVFGKVRLEGVELADVDPATRRPVPGTERRVDCDTLLLSVGLIPSNEVAATAGVGIDRRTGGPSVDESLETDVPGIFVAGNELHVHDLADYVSEEGLEAGANAAAHALGRRGSRRDDGIVVECGENVGSVTPQRIARGADEVVMRLRSRGRVQDADIVLVADGREARRWRRRIVVPSEMQTVKLSAADLPEGIGRLCVGVVAHGASPEGE
ncbi:MAG: FAD-dependent oxidoreductase, partial [Atopobiaceae bacterium]